MHLLLLLSSTSFAQQERLVAPGASFSSEDGAAATWVNPANLAFDPDPSLGIWYRQSFSQFDQTFAVSTTGGGTGLGVLYKNDQNGTPWWGLSSSLGVKLPENFRLGANLTWNLPDGPDNNFVSWDLGAGYRPFSWLGFGAVARNIGNPAPQHGVWSRYALATTLRPFEDKLELSADVEFVDDSAATVLGNDDLTRLGAVLRVRPASGLALRARGETNPALSSWTVGAGLEIYFQGLGGGLYTNPIEQDATAYLVTGEQDETLFGAGKRVAVIDLDRSLPYQPQPVLFGTTAESYVHLLQRLDSAATDRHVKGMLLDLSGPPLSWAQLEELRDAVAKVRAEGKPVVAYLSGSPSNGAYYLASACDKVYLHPAGSLDLIGLSLESQFFAGALDLVGVKAQYAKRADYKSSPEQWTNTEPSDPAREQMNALADDLFDALTAGIAEGRGMESDAVVGLIDEGPFTAAEALEKGLVDELYYPDELEDKLEGVFPKGFELDDLYGAFPETSGWEHRKQVAIVYVDGPIVGGESQSPGLLSGGNTGSSTVVRQLRQAAEDSPVKAVVLRVDSPGGSAFASDEIWRAVEQLQEEGKPVVVSMGGVAASGGYYVAAGADAIFAEPTTITGSIGVYGGKFSLGELYEKVGVGYEIYGRGRKASMYSMSREMDPVEYEALDRMIEDTYDQFKERVATGRGLELDEVEEVARGRVWSGARAKEVGLVDELGGLQAAITYAKVEAGLDADEHIELIRYGSQPNSMGDVSAQSVGVRLTPLAQLRTGALWRPEVGLPEDVRAWTSYAPLSEERVLVLLPQRIEVE
jgi:protease-4